MSGVFAAQGTPPAPPPPPPPGHELTVAGSLEGWDAVLLVVAVLAVAAVLLWPLIRAIARRIEAGAGGGAAAEVDDLRARVSALEAQQDRLAEVESRLDFAERLLAQQQEPERLKP